MPRPAASAKLARSIAVGGLAVFAGVALTACTGGSGSGSTASGSGASLPAAALPPGNGVGSTSTAGAAGVSGHPIKTVTKGHAKHVLNNGNVSVCSLITATQVDQIMRRSLPEPAPVAVGTYDECVTTLAVSGASLRVAWAVPPKASSASYFKQLTVNLPGRDTVSGLGGKAYCHPSSAASQLYLLNGQTMLEVFADTCGHATALAQDALQRL
jgi:hypothetical protein